MAEEYADDDDDKFAICELRKSVLKELKMHDSFVQVRYHHGIHLFMYSIVGGVSDVERPSSKEYY